MVSIFRLLVLISSLSLYHSLVVNLQAGHALVGQRNYNESKDVCIHGPCKDGTDHNSKQLENQSPRRSFELHSQNLEKRADSDGELEEDILIVAEATGDQLLAQEDKVAKNPPERDPPSWQDNSLEIGESLGTVDDASTSFLRDVGRLDIVKQEASYLSIAESEKGRGSAETYRCLVSAVNMHLVIHLNHFIPLTYDQASRIIYICWEKGSKPEKEKPRPELRYITVGVTDEKSLEILSGILDEKFESLGERSKIPSGRVIARDEINFRLASTLRHDASLAGKWAWSALYAVDPIKAVVRMLFTFPNTLYHHRISVIRYKVQYGDVEEKGPPSGANILLELEKTPQEAMVIPWQERIPIIQKWKLVPDPISHHASQPDIYRTSYLPYGKDVTNTQPTFIQKGILQGGVDYLFGVSSSESHIVFRGFSTGFGDPPLTDYQQAKVDINMAHVIYSTWVELAGQAMLRDLTFDYVDLSSIHILHDIREFLGTKAEEDIASTVPTDELYGFVYTKLKACKEIQVVETLIKNYGPNIGVSRITSIEIGIHTKPTKANKKGKPFMFITFKPLYAYETTTASPDLDITMAEDIASENSDFDMADSWPEGTGSLENLVMKTFRRGAFAVIIADLAEPVRNPWIPPVPPLDGLPPLYQMGYDGPLDTRAQGFPIDNPALMHLELLVEPKYDTYLPFEFQIKNMMKRAVRDGKSSKHGKYYEVIIRHDGQKPFKLASRAEFLHMVLESAPSNYMMGQVSLSDLLLATWCHTFGKFPSKRWYSNTAISNKMIGPRYFSFMETTEETKIMLKYIYDKLELPLTETLVIKNPFEVKFNRKPLKSEILGMRRYWILLLGLPEISAVQTLFSKYQSAPYIPGRLRVNLVMVKWVENSQDRKDTYHPELFASGVGWRTDLKLPKSQHPSLSIREHARVGGIAALFEQEWRHLKIDNDLVSPKLQIGEWQIRDVAQNIALPETVFRVFLDHGLPTPTDYELSQLKGPVFTKLRIQSSREEVGYNVAIARRQGCVIFEGLGGVLSNIPQSRAMISRAMLQAWRESAGNGEGRSGALDPDNLLFVNYLRVSQQTEILVRSLWKEYYSLGIPPSRILMRLDLGKTSNRYVPSLKYPFDNAGTWIVSRALLGTPEVGSVWELVSWHATEMQNQRIKSIYVDSSNSGDTIQISVSLTGISSV
ncbi:hypothetical protein ABW20_dc0107787 [Dactylellina cionopaga]|nr:hypothetical protein ABW20_dc0107787 [Dactylellina cionopaga]